LQQLLTKQVPTIGGIIYDERKNKGSERDIQFGRAYLFDGVNDYVTNANATLSGYNGTFSVAWKMNPSSLAVGSRRIFGTRTATNGVDVNIQVTGELQYYNGVATGTTTGAGIVAGQDQSYVLTTNGTTTKLYRNGVLVDTKTYGFNTVGTEFNIGCSFTTQSSFFLGKIWDVRTFSTELSLADALAIHNNTATTATPDAWFKCDEQSGTTSYDSSGNGRNGTITNATLSTFHSTQNVYSWQNEVGYSKPSTVFIPRNEAIPTQDVTGSALQFTGQVPYNADLEQSNGLSFDGVDDTISCGNIGTVNSFKGWVKFDATNQNILTLTDNVLTRIHVVAGVLTTGASLTFSSIKINEVTVTATQAGASLNTLAWCYLEVEFTSTSATALIFGRGDGAGTNGNIKTAGWSFLNNTTVQASYPMAGGAGTIAYDVSGNAKHGTLTNGPTWIKQDVYHYNITQGFNKYMFFDGVNDKITATYSSEAMNRIDISFILNTAITSTSTSLPLLNYNVTASENSILLGSATSVLTNEIITLAMFAGGKRTGVIGGTIAAGIHTISIRWNSGQTRYDIYLDGVIKTVVAGTSGHVNTPFVFKSTNFGASIVGGLFNGSIYDVKLYNTSDVLVHSYNGYGNTNADWADKTGSVNGTVSGSPVNIRIPAKSATLDVFNQTLRNTAGAYHNDAETLIDFTGNVLSPEAVRNSWETAWAFNTARTNPEFKRTLTSGGVDDRADRFLAYREALSGTNLIKVIKYLFTVPTTWVDVTPLTVKGGVVRVIDSATGDIARTTSGAIETNADYKMFFSADVNAAIIFHDT